MSEVNGPKFSVNQVNYNNITRTQHEISADQQDMPQLSDFSDPKAEALGRSMLFKGTDDTKHDLKALLENPQIAENSDKTFETAFKAAEAAGVENPYEEAASFATTSM